jgi:hypothetical protein
VDPGVIGRGALLGVLTPPPMGLAGRGAMPPPMPGDGGAAGRAGGAIEGAIGFGATGAAAAGFGAAIFFAAAGLRAGALRAAVFRAGFLAVLRAEVFRADVLRAVARLAPVLRAVLRAVREVLRAVLRVARAVFRAVFRGLAFLRVVRFFPLVLVAMAFCSDLL